MAESSTLIVAHGGREMAAFLGVPADERLLDADLTNLPTPRSIRCFERGEYQHGGREAAAGYARHKLGRRIADRTQLDPSGQVDPPMARPTRSARSI